MHYTLVAHEGFRHIAVPGPYDGPSGLSPFITITKKRAALVFLKRGWARLERRGVLLCAPTLQRC